MVDRRNDRVVAVIQDNAASLLRLARRHSLCADDAQDAYQRTLEIFLERADRIDDASAAPYLRTVCKHEAMRIRAARQRVLPSIEMDFDARASVDVGDTVDRAEGFERVARAAEALQGCKPDEVRALLLKADGSSYAEIAELLGWSYSKVNRCLVEGRARFLRLFAEIDSGAACEAWAPVLSALADGEAKAEELTSLRAHLRHCGACRAVLRSLYEAQPALRALLPPAVVAVAAPGWLDSLVGVFGDRIAKAQAVVEALTSSKAAAVVASTAVVASSGAAVSVPPPVPQAEKPAAGVVAARAARPAATGVVRVVARASSAPRSARRRATSPRPAKAPPRRVEFVFEAADRRTTATRSGSDAPRARASSRAAEFGFEG
jgi:RNA polymerase sigma factor (sigma-70 family)